MMRYVFRSVLVSAAAMTITVRAAEQSDPAQWVKAAEAAFDEVTSYTAVLRKQTTVGASAEEPAENVAGTRILVVDDNATNRRFLEVLLGSWRCRHDEACDGREALVKLRSAAVEKDPFRVVIVDMAMPGMNGETLGAAIKGDPALRDTELVMMTSLGTRGDAKRLEEIGFAAYLTKPVKQSVLYDCLATVLGSKACASEEAPARIVTRHKIAENTRRRVRILVAEDNVINQKVALSILGKLGFRADAVANGAEAINALETIPYDLVLMDCQMPEMDGYEATRAIRNGAAVPDHNIPILAMTAHAMTGDREKCLEAGMDDYITKPVDPQTLADMLEKWVSDGDARSPVPPARQQSLASSDTAVFDRDVLRKRMVGDDGLVDQVVETFLDDIPRQIAALKQALGAGDSPLARRLAHTIKGAAANVAAAALEKAALAVEKAADNGKTDRAGIPLDAVEQEFDRLAHLLASQAGEQA